MVCLLKGKGGQVGGNHEARVVGVGTEVRQVGCIQLWMSADAQAASQRMPIYLKENQVSYFPHVLRCLCYMLRVKSWSRAEVTCFYPLCLFYLQESQEIMEKGL